MKAILAYNDRNSEMCRAVVCDSAHLRAKEPFFVPDDRQWYGMVLRGVRIDRLGKNISLKFADRYYNEVVTAAHPFAGEPEDNAVDRWCRDGALVVSEAVSAENIDADMRHTLNSLIMECSRNMTLKTGDLVLAGFFDPVFKIENKSYDIFIPQLKGFPDFRLKIR